MCGQTQGLCPSRSAGLARAEVCLPLQGAAEFRNIYDHAFCLSRPAMSDPTVAAPAVVGLHHLRLPVSDVMRSRDWYISVFGFEPLLSVEEEDRVVGVVLGHSSGITLGLHYAPDLARALDGFCSVALSVGDAHDLARWCTQLDTLGVDHSAPADGHLGSYVEVPDPAGLIIELHTIGQPSAGEA